MRNKLIPIRVTEEEHKAYHSLSIFRNEKLSKIIRRLLDDECLVAEQEVWETKIVKEIHE